MNSQKKALVSCPTKHCDRSHSFRDILKHSKLGNQRAPATKDTPFSGTEVLSQVSELADQASSKTGIRVRWSDCSQTWRLRFGQKQEQQTGSPGRDRRWGATELSGGAGKTKLNSQAGNRASQWSWTPAKRKSRVSSSEPRFREGLLGQALLFPFNILKPKDDLQEKADGKMQQRTRLDLQTKADGASWRFQALHTCLLKEGLVRVDGPREELVEEPERGGMGKHPQEAEG